MADGFDVNSEEYRIWEEASRRSVTSNIKAALDAAKGANERNGVVMGALTAAYAAVYVVQGKFANPPEPTPRMLEAGAAAIDSFKIDQHATPAANNQRGAAAVWNAMQKARFES